MSMRKFIRALFVAVLTLGTVAVLASCGGDPGTGGEGGKTGDVTYSVTFRFSNGKTVTKNLKENEVPAEKHFAKDLPRGYAVVEWDREPAPAREDATYSILITNEERVSAPILKKALHTEIVGPDVAGIDYQSDFESSAAFFVLCLEEYSDPQNGVVADRIVDGLTELCYGGKEPAMEAWPYWSLESWSAAIALAINTPTVISRFTGEISDMKDRTDCIMRCFAVLTSLSSADWNNYTTGPGLVGNYNKGWNPNYALANVLPIVNAVYYFGSAKAVNDILFDFDYDEYLADFDKYGFQNIKTVWTGLGLYKDDVRTMMMEGGDVVEKNDYLYKDSSTGGTGAGVIPPDPYTGFSYSVGISKKTFTLDDYLGIADELFFYNFSGGPVTANNPTGAPGHTIKNGDQNPMLGKNGMLVEFAEENRSSYKYAKEDFILAAIEIAFLESMGEWTRDTHDDIFAYATAGMNDFLYKGRMGYHSYSQWGETDENDADTSGGLLYARSMWLRMFDDTMTSYYGESDFI